MFTFMGYNFISCGNQIFYSLISCFISFAGITTFNPLFANIAEIIKVRTISDQSNLKSHSDIFTFVWNLAYIPNSLTPWSISFEISVCIGCVNMVIITISIEQNSYYLHKIFICDYSCIHPSFFMSSLIIRLTIYQTDSGQNHSKPFLNFWNYLLVRKLQVDSK